MDIQIEVAVIGLIQAVMVVIIAGLLSRNTRKQQQQIDDVSARDKLLAEERLKAMEVMSANVGLGIATARALQEGHVNGQVDAAIKKAEETDNAYKVFIGSIAAQKLK